MTLRQVFDGFSQEAALRWSATVGGPRTPSSAPASSTAATAPAPTRTVITFSERGTGEPAK